MYPPLLYMHSYLRWLALGAILFVFARALIGLAQGGTWRGSDTMWAKAAAHWSRAVMMSAGNVDYRLALASACANLGQFDRAREHLAVARQIAPDNPEVHALAARISALSSPRQPAGENSLRSS